MNSRRDLISQLRQDTAKAYGFRPAEDGGGEVGGVEGEAESGAPQPEPELSEEELWVQFKGHYEEQLSVGEVSAAGFLSILRTFGASLA